ncbi:MAG: radical SAM protein [Anaerolineaceae bacterium]|nr:radical SAM protein [Anaerolineaceae bacterium]
MTWYSSLHHYPYLFYHYVLHRDKPLLASFKLTYRCNLTCQQCPFFSLQAEELQYEQVLDVLDRLYQRGNRLVVLEGGEPMLWKDGTYSIHDVVATARNKFFSVGMTTNGTLPLDVAVDSLWVSIDGLEETHNALRGAPVFSRIMENIKKSQHPRLYAHITLNSVNAPEIPKLIRFLEGKVRGITVQLYYPYNHKDDLFLDFERREKLLEEIIQLKRAGFPILNSNAALQALKRNTWKCDDRLIDNANPDGSITQGCYLKNRADIDCSRCGFSPYTEISLASQMNLQSILAGQRIFF